MGGVIHRDIEWDNKYVACSPFPQLVAFGPVHAPAQGIEAEFAGSGGLVVTGFTLDGLPAPYRTLSTSPLRIGFTPQGALGAGTHVVRMTVVNRIAGQAFQDSFVQSFVAR